MTAELLRWFAERAGSLSRFSAKYGKPRKPAAAVCVYRPSRNRTKSPYDDRHPRFTARVWQSGYCEPWPDVSSAYFLQARFTVSMFR